MGAWSMPKQLPRTRFHGSAGIYDPLHRAIRFESVQECHKPPNQGMGTHRIWVGCKSCLPLPQCSQG